MHLLDPHGSKGEMQMDPARLPEGIPEQLLLDLYVRSGGDTLQRMREALRNWAETGSEAGLADVRRLAHNLKGASLQLGFDDVARLTGALERFAGELLRRRRPGDPAELALIEAAADLAASVFAAIAAAAPIPDLTGVTERLEADPR
jgi:chemotaxis protein histidine kinase CheA